jgi:hypothetical protein
VPAAVPVAAPVAAPVQAAAAPLPSTPEEARRIFTQLISRLAGPEGDKVLDAVSAALWAISLTAGGTADGLKLEHRVGYCCPSGRRLDMMAAAL